MKVSLLLEQSIKKQFRFKHIECLFVWILITRRCQKICKIYYTTGRLHMRLCLIIEALLERKIRTHLGRLHSSLKNPPSYKCMERHSDIWYNAMPICGKVNTRNQFVFALGSCGIFLRLDSNVTTITLTRCNTIIQTESNQITSTLSQNFYFQSLE